LKIIIIGAGEVGFHIANRLAHENKDVVVIDHNEQAIRRVEESIDVQVVDGKGSSPAVLEKAGIKAADILLAVTDSDETNLVACLFANIISPATKKLARIRNGDYDKYHENFRKFAPNIDTIINPEIEVVKIIDGLLSVPGAVDVSKLAGDRVKVIGVQLEKNSRMAGVRLIDFPRILGSQRTLIAAVVRDEKVFIPRGNSKLLPGDIVYFVSQKEKLSDTLSLFDKYAQPLNNVLIVGGGRLAVRLAMLLEEKSIHTKIIEKNKNRCVELAEKFNKVVVLCGNGTDQRLLKEENVGDMDAVITLTNDEEINILASLLSKRMGARKTITKISNFSYLAMMPAIGIDQVVSPRLSAINTILQHIRRGKVLSAISIKGEQAEILEAEALETSDIVDKPLNRISFPKGAIVVSIIHDNDIIIPTGDSIIRPGDKIIIFALSQAISKVEKILSVKLEYF